jgi:competence protein ComFC
MISRLMELLAPTSCLECGREGAVICTTCIVNLGTDTPPLRVQSEALSGVSVGAYYAGAVKELILQLKFHRLRAATDAAARLIIARSAEWPELEVVTSVPVAASRYRERGYNQSELIAKAVARLSGLPYSPALGRLTATHQIGLDRETRFAQVAGAFYAVRLLPGRRVLIIDDVVTTGATLSECAQVLTSAGARSVWAAAVARH